MCLGVSYSTNLETTAVGVGLSYVGVVEPAQLSSAQLTSGVCAATHCYEQHLVPELLLCDAFCFLC